MSTSTGIPSEVAGRLSQFPAIENAIAANSTNPSLSPLSNERNVLRTLVAFYHSETMWVYRTRATMELDVAQAPDTSPMSCPADADPAPVGMSVEDEELDRVLDDVDVVLLKGKRNQDPTLWMRRKKGFKLRLDGISTTFKPKNPVIACKAVSGRASMNQPIIEHPANGIQVLEMFETLLQSRMESCMRLERMVKESNDTQL